MLKKNFIKLKQCPFCKDVNFSIQSTGDRKLTHWFVCNNTFCGGKWDAHNKNEVIWSNA